MTATSRKQNLRIYATVTVLALIFWFMVKMSKRYDYITEIPLRVVINNPEVCLKYPVSQTVRVEFVGRGIDLLQLMFFHPVYEIDLSDVKDEIVLNLPDHREYVRLPDDQEIEVRSIVTPHQIKFELDKRVEKKVPVVVQAEVTTEAGFTLVGMYPAPDSVRVSGPAAYVDTLSRLVTRKERFERVNQAFRKQVALQYNGEFYAEYDPETVQVLFDVQRLAEKEIEEVPVEVIHVPANLEVVPLPPRATIRARGGEKVLAEAEATDFRILIDFEKQWHRGVTRMTPTLESSLQVVHMEVEPPEFELIVQKKRRKQ
ncbi:MAG: hypothetical protein D6681_11685 [Calditrichaeota bacterium]|nr:MAG: hypothetical protein D6681_11685 [Calditrichota bacterium]